MKDKSVLKLLNHLAQLDVDSVHAYSQVIDANVITDKVIQERLIQFRDEHEQHVNRLRDEIRKRGGEPPHSSMDFKDYIIEGFLALGIAAGMPDALKALEVAEGITNRAYSDAVSSDAPADLKKIIRKHFSDEKIHSDYIISNS